MIVVLAGFVAGAVHVLAGPDHLAAMAPLASGGGQRRVWALGWRWGLGHASGVILLGTLAALVGQILPMERISSVGERLVGVVLIGIGLWGLLRALRQTGRLHQHEHEHGGERHVHVHVHAHADAHAAHERQPRDEGHRHTHAAFAVGVLHGIAGGSHLVGVLPALAMSTPRAAAYVGAFGLGTVGAMIAFTALLGLVARGLGSRGARGQRLLLGGCSAAAVLTGAFWLSL